MAAKTYVDIFSEHNGFASYKWVHYFFVYDCIFKRFLEKGEPIKILEIGVQNGGSLEIWKKYLPQNSKIYGVDIDEKCLQLEFSEGISFHLGSATDTDFMEKTFGDIEFDVIIDDGSHICKDVIDTFEYLFPKLKNGGCYIVEDIHTSYWKEYGGGLHEWTSIEYFKKWIDIGINREYIGIDLPNLNILKIGKMISHISFYDSICVIDKFYGIKEMPFKDVTTGELALVNEEPVKLNRTIKERKNDIDIAKRLFCG